MASAKMEEVNQELSQSHLKPEEPREDDDGSVRVVRPIHINYRLFTLMMLHQGDWLLQYDANGNEFWVNQVSGVSAWEIPSEEDAAGNDTDTSRHTSRLQTPANAGGAYTIEL